MQSRASNGWCDFKKEEQMTPKTFMTNAVRKLAEAFPGYFEDAKHNYYDDFGWPKDLEFNILYTMYRRNGMGKAAVEKTIEKTWQDMPMFIENADPKETPTEADLRKKFEKILFWQNVSEADRRSLVGGYGGLILRLADGKQFVEPVDMVPGGIDGLAGVIPAWKGQLTVSEWHDDLTLPNYGEPKMFSFNEANLQKNMQGQTRAFEVHPDRVIVWSKDGTVHCDSLLEAGYNSLQDMEKVSGAGGEGFYKNAKSAPILTVNEGANLEAMAKGMGKEVTEIADAINEQVKDFNTGFDAMLLLQGMKADKQNVSLVSPEHFFGTPLMIFAASVSCPQKILTGSQTGERASTEDAAEWARTNMSRRNLICKPKLMEIIDRLVKFKILRPADWSIQWSDLTESSAAEKMDRAVKMAEVNAKSAVTRELVYLPEEIREVTHDEPLGVKSKYTDDEE
jgi:hypothetical protein